MSSCSSPVKKIPLLCRGHSRPVMDLSYSPILGDGSFYLVSACLDGQPMLRDGATGDWIGTFVGHKGSVWSAQMNPDATQVVTASADCTARVWSAIDGSELFCFPHKKVVKAAAISVDALLATGGQEAELKIFDLNKPEVPPRLIGSHQDVIRDLMWGKEDSLLVSAGAAHHLHFWDPRTPCDTPVKTVETFHSIMEVDKTHDGNSLLVTSGRQVQLISLATLETTISHTLAHPAATSHVSPNKKHLVTGGPDFYVRLYDFFTGEEMEAHRAHHGPVHCVRFAPDGHTFSSGSEDGTIRIWLTKNKPYSLWDFQAKKPQQCIASTSESTFSISPDQHQPDYPYGASRRKRAQSAMVQQ